MTSEELIEFLQQHPGKEIEIYDRDYGTYAINLESIVVQQNLIILEWS